MRRRRLLCVLIAFFAAVLVPARASAHGGLAVPVATSFFARIGATPPGIQARIVDGDQQLWLRVPSTTTVVVLGFSGEPYLRFSPHGIEINERSPAAYLNRAQPTLVPITASPLRPPQWRKIAGGLSYRWHEDRLHTLALTARTPRAAYVGRWTIPLRIDSRPAQIAGGLWYAPPPTLLWFWPILIALASLAGLVRLRIPRLDTSLLGAFTLAGIVAILATHLELDLHGRPTIAASQLAWLALSSIFAAGATMLYLRPRWRAFAGLATATYALTDGFALLATLQRGHVVAWLPAPIERLTALTALIAGLGALVILLTGEAAARNARESPGSVRPASVAHPRTARRGFVKCARQRPPTEE